MSKLLRDNKGRFISPNTKLDNAVQQAQQTQKTKQVQKVTRTYVSFILDESGSMSHLKTPTLKFINGLIQTIRDASKDNGQETYFSLSTFANRTRKKLTNNDINTVRPLTASDYYPSGGTALFDAVSENIDDLDRSDNKEDSFLVYVITDGEENSSTILNKNRIQQLILDRQKTDRWTFVFHLPRGSADNFVRKFNISRDNIREWDQTEQGLQVATQESTEGFSNYYRSRSMNKTSTKKFFADLSQVTPTQIKRELDDLSGQYRTYEVDKEYDIKSFVEARTGRPYQPGSTFYELTKAEKVQAYKDILVMKRGEKKIYGGTDARDLLNLPKNDDIKLDIKNLSEYKLFLQSTSQNRKLVRGTTILVKQ